MRERTLLALPPSGSSDDPRHLLSIDDLADADVERLLRAADGYAERERAGEPQEQALAGRTVVTLFFESSTRTSTSFELAATSLGAVVARIETAGSSITKGESLRDTVQTLDAYGPAVLVVRHSRAGAVDLVARYSRASVVNAGDGARQHPTQALLDLLALRRRVGDVRGLRVFVVGDVLHSRVARSTIALLARSGCEVTACGPPTLLPPGIESLGCAVTHDIGAIDRADVVYALRMQRERMRGDHVPSLAEYVRNWRIDTARLGASQLLMHPGPVNRGVEVASELVDDPRSLILDQVRAGLHARMAVLADLVDAPASAGVPSRGVAVGAAHE